MKKRLFNLSPQAINAIFSYLCQDNRIVTWIADNNFSQQIYLSDSFHSLCGWSTEMMYQNMSLWNDILIPEDKTRAESELVRSYSNNDPFKLLQYRLHNPQGDILCIEDHHFPIEDLEGNIIAHGGYVSFLTADEWATKRENNLDDVNDQKKGLSFYETIMQELHVKFASYPNDMSKHEYSVIINNQRIMITSREAETLYYLLKGYPTKLIARELTISPRTVEIHILHLREKLDARSRLSLLSQIENVEEIRAWSFKE